jgi:acyl-CoA thioester hydrolase
MTEGPAASVGVELFEKRMIATWGDMDYNGHMRNTAFLDKSADLRLMFFTERGMPVEALIRQHIGPVVRKDELEYFREIRLFEEMRVTLTAAGLSDDGGRFLLRNEFWRDGGTLAARVTSSGGWLDLAARKLVAPPEALRTALHRIQRTDDFQRLPSLRSAAAQDASSD